MPPPAEPGAEPAFGSRVARLPHLGLGISTEFEARAQGGLDPLALHRARPELVRFLEVGADLERGVDADARAWCAAGLPVTYHFLDVNLEEGEDLTPAWMAATAELARELGAAWLCGDAGLWHVGARDRGHGVLMPPILEPASAREMAASVRTLRLATGLEVLPENPPAHLFLGRLHLLDYYARVVEEADSGFLCDVAHLAVYQHVRGHAPLDGLDGFPWERVVELHVAGGRTFRSGSRTFIEDDHGLEVLGATWELLEAVLPRARNLRALVFEGERNPLPDVIPVFERLRALWPAAEGPR